MVCISVIGQEDLRVVVLSSPARRAAAANPGISVVCALFVIWAAVCPSANSDAVIRIRDTSGFPASTTVVGVNFSSSPGAVAVNFRVNYDPFKMQFLGADEGPTAQDADKQVQAEVPSLGTVSVIVYGLNNNVIDSGRLVNLSFVILGTASPGQQLSLVGTDPASTSTEAKPIPTTITDATITVTTCTAPSPPTNVVASDGQFNDHVNVSWNAANGASSYIVYRSDTNYLAGAIKVGQTLGTFYNDFGATAASLSAPGGCGGSANLSFTSQYYWVVSQNPCGASVAAGPDTGYRGGSKAATTVTSTYEPVMPPQALGNEISLDDTIAIRLRAEEPIASVWGQVVAKGFEDSSVQWLRETADGDDGWVVYEPEALWLPGETIVFTVGGTTSSGAVIGPLTYAYAVSGDPQSAVVAQSIPQPAYDEFDAKDLLLPDESNDMVQLIALDESKTPLLPESLEPVYVVVPGGPFENPQRIWLPMPEDVAPEDLVVFYYQGDGENGTWYPGANVDGWLVPGSQLALDLEHASYFGILVNHGGVVSLGAPGLPPRTAQASIVPGVSGVGPMSNLLPLAVVITCLAFVNYQSRRRRGCFA